MYFVSFKSCVSVLALNLFNKNKQKMKLKFKQVCESMCETQNAQQRKILHFWNFF